jgi:hypothetical protein
MSRFDKERTLPAARRNAKLGTCGSNTAGNTSSARAPLGPTPWASAGGGYELAIGHGITWNPCESAEEASRS